MTKVTMSVYAMAVEFDDGEMMNPRPVFLRPEHAEEFAKLMEKSPNVKSCDSWLATISVDEEDVPKYTRAT